MPAIGVWLRTEGLPRAPASFTFLAV